MYTFKRRPLFQRYITNENKNEKQNLPVRMKIFESNTKNKIRLVTIQ